MTLATGPAHELAPLIRQKKVSAVELMQAVLNRIGRLESHLNAMAFLDAEAAMQGSREAEAALDALGAARPFAWLADHDQGPGRRRRYADPLWHTH